MMEVIRDKYGRTFKTLRVSLLSHCNLACVYCVAGEEELREMNGASNEMGVEGLLGVIRRLHEELRLETIRLTGGEPLLYPGLVQLVEGLVSIGLTEIKLTTN